MSTSQHQSKILQTIYGIKPAIQSLLFCRRQGKFINELPDILVNVDQEIQNILHDARDGGREFCLSRFITNDLETLLTPREFLIRLYGLKSEELAGRRGEEIVELLNDLIDDAEEAFLSHIVKESNHNLGIFFKLRISGITSSKADKKGMIPLRKKRALFSVAEYETELEAAKVPRFYCRRLTEKDSEKILQLYAELPDSIKDLFFSVSWRGQLRNDLPLYLTRDLLLFADNARWEKLTVACEKGNRASAMEAYSEFLREFLVFERHQNGFSLGAARKEKNIDKFSAREISLLEFCKSAEHVMAMWKTSPKAASLPSGEEKD